MALIASVRWQERYASFAINRKLAGILSPGIYWGFEVSPAGGMNIRVHHGDNPDYPASVAVIEREGYSITLRMDAEEVIDIPGSGDWYVVLEAYYTPGQETYQTLKMVTSPADHHVILAKISVPEGAEEILDDMISYEERMIGNPALGLLQLSNILTSLTQDNIVIKARLTNLENWAKQNGYNPETIY